MVYTLSNPQHLWCRNTSSSLTPRRSSRVPSRRYPCLVCLLDDLTLICHRKHSTLFLHSFFIDMARRMFASALLAALELTILAVVFLGLNAVRILSIVALLLVFSSSILVMVTNIKAVNHFQAGRIANSTDTMLDCDYIECVPPISHSTSALIVIAEGAPSPINPPVSSGPSSPACSSSSRSSSCSVRTRYFFCSILRSLSV